MQPDTLDEKINDVFEGRSVRKDLVQRIKKGTNIPTFVLEFLLARYCPTDDPDEIQEGLKAVTETIQTQYVRPNEANSAQSKVQRQDSHRFIDKVRVIHSEKEKRHWAEMQNFGSKRIAINERHYKDNDRLLEGGLWCEVTVCYNQVEDDDYTFYIEDLRPIQISRFSYEDFCAGREEFTRDEWMALVLRSVGLEPNALTPREKLHFLARLFPLVEQNYNLLELGPRGTGKSYVYSEFTPYSTLISGGQTSTATLFYNKVRKEVGIIGYWDVIAFDEVAGIKVKDPGTIQILKDYMANGHFNIGAEVIAPASMSFVGNIDDSIPHLVASENFDLCRPLPPQFDLAVIHRFHSYVPGWEIPAFSSKLVTDNYGLITDYLAEAFHYLFGKVNLFSTVKQRARLNSAHEGRDEAGVIKTVSALCKLLHPGQEPTDDEFEEYLSYAIELRRRVKEQLNKRKKDDEFAAIDLGFFNSKGEEIIISCPESRGVRAMLEPTREQELAPAEELENPPTPAETVPTPAQSSDADEPTLVPEEKLQEGQWRLYHGDRGGSYQELFAKHLKGAKKIALDDPYIRTHYQVVNFVRFCEMCVELGSVEEISLCTSYDSEYEKDEVLAKLTTIETSLADHGIVLKIRFSNTLHDREIRADNGWTIQLGRGLDIYQSPEDWLEIGANDLQLRMLKETTITYLKTED
ncbi:BREX system Lon protease-like protein BrxL [Roseibacillus ishigakijimensis]|uniref:BREX system Lon protease-like protein BrxL n=1 Tax=Roseibacillus ishigakijimensis TaxID=454146 RepID=A0A934RQE0_9BACT|nr:BREX system Lon protease-like protein BrxL [Roseibacillus ishigakijimensis]MBK1835060.1 BREX system Lon protease-like protein BrxL [Roseibacillus ishigakijimensis]